jgi:hypothetical protein
MKKIILLAISILPLLASGQTNSSLKVIFNSNFETNFDSVFFHPESIKSIETDRISRTVYIQTKDSIWKYKTIDEILKDYPLYPQLITYKTLTPVFYIDDKPINKITDAKIDRLLFTQVVFKDLYHLKSIDVPCINIVIVDIKTYRNKPPIRIRGNSIQELEDYYKIKE